MHMVKMQDEAHSSIEKMDEALEQLSHEGVLIGRDHGVECSNSPMRGEPVHV
jgi:hypothetical protein